MAQAEPATLLRVFHRRRSAPHIENDYINTVRNLLGIQPACAGGSRWHRYAFGMDDVNQVMNISSAGAGRRVLSIHAVPRAVVELGTLQQAALNPSYKTGRFFSSAHDDSNSYRGGELDVRRDWIAKRETNKTSPFYNKNVPGKEWMAMDLGSAVAVVGVITQGRVDKPWEYTSNFTVATSLDNKTWTAVPGELFVGAQTEKNAKTPTAFRNGVGAVLARFVKIYPVAWVGPWATMRAAAMIDVTVETNATSPLSICTVKEWIGGDMTIGPDCNIKLANPPVRFTAEHMPQADRVVASVSKDAKLTTVVGRHADTSQNDEVLLPDKGVAWSCGARTPQAGPLFALLKGSSTGEGLVFDRRLEIKSNTLEKPLVLAGRGECTSAPKTFLNAHTCVAGKESCATRSYTSQKFRLSEQNILQFYRRAGLYVVS